ncbi:ROK family transcriptional regulator [Bacillaceae bacterium S4-13-58]
MGKLRKGNKELIKDINMSVVIDAIRKNAPISRSDVAVRTGLSLSTITNMVEELKEQDLVYEIGTANSTGGRRAILLEFNYNYGSTIGIKIMEDHLIFALTNLNGEILQKSELNFERYEEPSVVVDLLKVGAKELMVKASNANNLLGIGVAASGLVNSDDGIVIRSSLLNWNNVNIRDMLKGEFNVPIYIDNDVNAYNNAEIWMGYGTQHKNYLCMSVGDGLGSSIVVDGKIYSGEFGGAGEFGHTIIYPNGEPCHCGQKGCLEAYTSKRFLEKEVGRLLDKFPNSELHYTPITFESMKQAADNQDALAIKVLKKLGENLGIGFINAINSINPELIVMAGEGMIAKDYFLPYAIQISKNNFFSKAGYSTNIEVSKLGDDAWVQGASLLSVKHLFQPPLYEKNSYLINSY